MKQNDFYEVDGSMDFIPVTINETYADSVGVTVDNYMQGYRLVVKEVYRFPKANEPQKPVVPQFVADWYESLNRNEDSFRKIFPFVHAPHESANDTSWIPEDVQIWLSNWDNSFTLSNMHQFGYTVEKEKLYTVEIPNPNRNSKGCAKFRLEKLGDKVYLVKRKSKDVYQNKDSQKLTEQEIRKDFEWAWQQGFAKEVTE